MNYVFDQNWSFSKLMMYETCPMRVRLKYIDRLPEPALPPDNPMERGSRIHNNLELYVKGEAELQNEAKKLEQFKPALGHLQELYACKQATAENDLFFNRDWDLCEKRSVWLWLKKDFCVTDGAQVTDREAVTRTITGDYKSGKSGYKTIEHIQQLQLYAACDALEYPNAEVHISEIWYVDEGSTRQMTYSHEQALSFVGRFAARAERMYADRYFRPNPSRDICRYCPYSPRGTGACPVGV